ncbi:hypothetical protein HELRODRAFT_95507 [Helobdella robusta]|uniref:Anti-silencing function protein 1 n=1 Tax=Helobdella robusta TaxID=6412 RepID=T1G962_HELRO|nr:hypothetical protein HELRODRAFT_95507 [Helobdella robusta]ESN96595.1 hypothetical protein HELRODRAFT_95507 [Helobdella robusta]
MAKVNICNVVVKDNPCPFMHPFQFEITFECLDGLDEDLEWKIIYVGSAESEEYDQILDTVLVGPLIGGKHMFVFEADPPDATKIPKEDVVGVTVILLTCLYKKAEFIRVGYYVNNEYTDPELKENPPAEPDFSKLQRNILATCPRVTRFKINWGDEEVNVGNGIDQLSLSSQNSFGGTNIFGSNNVFGSSSNNFGSSSFGSDHNHAGGSNGNGVLQNSFEEDLYESDSRMLDIPTCDLSNHEFENSNNDMMFD